MSRKLTMGSLFDGSGGFPLASVLAGIEPVWASEIEPFPIRVTTKRLPNMRHYGDVSAISGAEVPPVDIITFGSPCQDLSTANGNRQGLAGSRSGLFLEAIRIIKEMREATNGVYPAVAVFENVPGAFSANGGEDFRRVLEEFAHVRDESVSVPRPAGGRWNDAGEIVADGWSLAWRVLDAQYWGVPQRRRRIFLAADLRGQRAGNILLIRESLRGHPFAGNAEREETPAGTGRSADKTGKGWGAIGFYPQMKAESMCITEETQPCLVNGTNPGFQNGVCIPLEGNGSRPSHQGDGYGQAGDHAYTLNTVEQHAVCYRKSARAQSSEDGETWVRDDRKNTLNTFDLGDTRTSEVIVTAHAIGNGQADQTGLHDKAGALNCMHDQQAVLVYDNHPHDSRLTRAGNAVQSLPSQMGTGGNNTPLVATAVDCRNGTENPIVNGTLQAKSNGGYNMNSNNIVRVPLSFQERAGCAGGQRNTDTGEQDGCAVRSADTGGADRG